MARRRQFKGISRDVLDSFVSRYNDLNGYWALGQFVNILRAGPQELCFHLREGHAQPSLPDLVATSLYYRHSVLRLMAANNMPQEWLAKAIIGFAMIELTTASCYVEIMTDLGTIYRSSQNLEVRPHNRMQERRRTDQFGPSNQKGE